MGGDLPGLGQFRGQEKRWHCRKEEEGKEDAGAAWGTEEESHFIHDQYSGTALLLLPEVRQTSSLLLMRASDS